MDFVFYFCSSQILILCSLICFFARGILWRTYARDERPQPSYWTPVMLGLGTVFLLGSFLAVWMLVTLVNQNS
ncbi:MAG: hypothetical protein U0694_15600 [Anaerolineae bacterium]